VAAIASIREKIKVKYNIKINMLATILLVSLAGCGKPGSPPSAASQDAASSDSSGKLVAEIASEQITADYMREVIIEISDDKYAGRGPGSEGDAAARQYLAREMASMGILPGAADGSWEQPFDLVGIDAAQPDEWKFKHADGTLTLKQSQEFIIGSGVQADKAAVHDAEIVFVGYGIQAPEYDWDDFKGQDLRGKVLLMLNNDPDWDPELFEGETRLWYGRWDYKYLSAARQGAVGAIIIHTTPSAGYVFQVVRTSWTGPQFELPAGDEPRSQVKAWLTEDAARELVALGGLDLDTLREAADNRDFAPVALGLATSVEMDVSISRVQSANVLGLIPGSDPVLKDEVVIYTAHHDHLGVGAPNDAGDTIYNGARDNGSGVAMVMAIAKAIKALPQAPRRSVLIALVAAEEQGLLGSEYYAAHPTFRAGKIAANLNYDSANIWGLTHDVDYVGLGKSSIDSIAIRFASAQGRVVKPDAFSDRGYFYRSDQFNFAKIGVPAMYLHTGTDFVDRPEGWGKEQIGRYYDMNYHQPSDEYDDSWNFDGIIADTLLGFWTGLAIANADDMPTWNEGDEFEAVRLKALAAEKQ
jgi:predicted small lipoprotein YifL